MGRVTLFNNFIAKYRAAIVIGLITMALLYWFVLYDGDGYIFQISPAFNGKEMQVQAINDHSVEEQIPFHAHDLEHLVLHFDLQQERSDYSDTRIIIEILQKDRPLGLWELSAEQTNAPYDCYVYTNLHNLPAENLTLKISAKGTGKVGIVVGETTEGVSVDYRAFVTSYSRARLLLTFSAVLLILLVGYIVLIQGKSIEKIFLYLYISLGLLYLLVCPILSEPDAKNHYCRAYEVSEGAFLSRTNAQGDAEGAFALPQGWVNANGATQVSLYESWFQRNYQIEDEGKELYQFNNMALYSPVSYLPQATAFAVARLFTHNFLATVMFARLITFVMAGALFYLAIHLSPFGKHYLLWVALLPMGMELAVSISPDMITTALVCLLVSMVCRYRYGTAKVSKAELILLYAVAILLGQYKIVYVGCCLLLFLIPTNAFGGKKAYFIHAFVLGGLVLITSLGWLHIASSFLDTQYATASGQKEFIIYHPKQFLFTLISTAIVYGDDLIHTMIGSRLGALELATNPLLVMAVFIGILRSLVLDRYKNRNNKRDLLGMTVFSIIIIVTVFLIFSSIYIQWNSRGEKLVGGLQGRYLLPILYPLLLVVGRQMPGEQETVNCLQVNEQYNIDLISILMVGIHLCFAMQLFLYFVY